jgi:hypothetical protein
MMDEKSKMVCRVELAKDKRALEYFQLLDTTPRFVQSFKVVADPTSKDYRAPENLKTGVISAKGRLLMDSSQLTAALIDSDQLYGKGNPLSEVVLSISIILHRKQTSLSSAIFTAHEQTTRNFCVNSSGASQASQPTVGFES